MCGITGFYSNSLEDLNNTILFRMNQELIHRGPDGSGMLTAHPAHLAMRRLAIIDLQSGDQPIYNESGSIGVVYNGELYNYQALRRELLDLGHIFATESDTEVLVHGYEEWGEELPKRLNGMFAFALWDSDHQTLMIARDHLGIKPLYYAQLPDGGVAFGSEIKSMVHLVPHLSIDPNAVEWLLATRYIPHPYSIYREIRKLPPGHTLSIRPGAPIDIKPFWSLTFRPGSGEAQVWIRQLREVLTDAIGRQMVSDVPLGAFLSGGIDSSIVVGVMSQLSRKPIETFSVVFPKWSAFDESVYSQMIADRFGTIHHRIEVEGDVASQWHEMASHLDEPIADPAILPTWLMSKVTRDRVTVALTGEGADELFAGYDWYGWPTPLPIPRPLKRMTRPLIRSAFHGRRGRHRLSALMADQFADFYLESILSHGSQRSDRQSWYQPEWRSKLDANRILNDLQPVFNRSAGLPQQTRTQWADLVTWLPGNPLPKADLATMKASLEGRVPFLDQAVVDFALTIPPELLRREKTSKWILRQAFADLLPDEIFNRPKQAFNIPIGNWLRDELKPFLLDATRPDSRIWDCLRPEPILAMRDAHLSGSRDHSRMLWTLLHLSTWWEDQSF